MKMQDVLTRVDTLYALADYDREEEMQQEYIRRLSYTRLRANRAAVRGVKEVLLRKPNTLDNAMVIA